MITVNGRVRATVRLKAEGASEGAATCVVASTWASNRPVPRTVATGVAFELETSDGDVYGVDPFEALLALPVRRRTAEGDARAEAAWIAHGDEVEVEGELRRGGRGGPKQTVLALRLSTPGATSVHRIPPRSLARGEAEKLAQVDAAAPPLAQAAEDDAQGEPPTTPSEPATAAEPASPRKPPKKKRPDSSGTPTPIQ